MHDLNKGNDYNFEDKKKAYIENKKVNLNKDNKYLDLKLELLNIKEFKNK